MDLKEMSRLVRWRRVIGAVATVGLMLVGGTARADVITGPAPEDDCPEGSRGQNCRDIGHGSDSCAPRTCVRDEDCGEGELCENADLCISQVECGWEPDGGPTYADSVEGSCDEEACAAGTCETMEVCMTAPVFNSAGGCDCTLAGTSPGGGLPVIGLVVALVSCLVLRRRAP